MISPRLAAAALLSAALAIAAPPATAAEPAVSAGRALRFTRDGKTVKQLDRAALEKACGRSVSIDDPYYGRRKTYRACPLDDVLRMGFGVPAAELAGEDVTFRASDGYAKASPGARLAEPGGFLAYSDAEVDHGLPPAWEPIERKQLDPGPYYLVWAGEAQRDTHRYPWPYQLVEIEVASLARLYPHIVPTSAAEGSPARQGYEIFKSDCVACHAMNGEGGKVGPDLNVPRSIVEYRPAEQIKAYVRDPASFRYTSMPAHPYLSDAQLDALLAYFAAMSRLKHDPGKPS